MALSDQAYKVKPAQEGLYKEVAISNWDGPMTPQQMHDVAYRLSLGLRQPTQIHRVEPFRANIGPDIVLEETVNEDTRFITLTSQYGLTSLDFWMCDWESKPPR